MTLGWGIVGVGEFARQRIGPALGESTAGVLTGSAGRLPEQADSFAARFGGRAYGSFEEMLAADDVDVVFVATPNHLHRDLVIAAAAAGKHVLCEKPLAPTSADADAMIAACADAGVLLRVGFYLRFDTLLRRVADVVASGRLGRLVDVSVQRCAPVDQAGSWRLEQPLGGGVLADVGVHLFDTLQWVTGQRFAEVTCWTDSRRDASRPEDTAVVAAEMDGGTLVTVRCSREVAFGRNDLVICGTEGMLRTGPLRWRDQFDLYVTTAQGEEHEVFDVGNAYARELEAMAREVAGEHTHLATGEDGRGVVAISEAISDAGVTGSAVRVAGVSG